MVQTIVLILFTFVAIVSIVIYFLMWLRVPFTLSEIKMATEKQSQDIKELKEQLTRIENALKKEK